ncbi:hypothetical protein CEUSTIGMA_g7755.t1 [Chlamydomonas eustigma]|uniref:Fe-containing alcohol dehydrogenase-like C-terminal domain-containing protein n=1 Tax=Chlamydomonas eustigma TaxID=1157962 RepID=A0A250XB56_9CHLO|nr:hypothetical protein CEUSTIGMA_g7755.t1 [Chlamydomonas eustigma]|eukprot:GAX80317.1 hypothetical protein CEUSTIGMA_g7755.t1 [Chlamydomonas eustigma]
MHYAASIAGMAFANAFLGICHSMAHAIGSEYHIPHGAANAMLLSHVVRYNATDVPFRQAAFPQYEYAHVKADYAQLSDALGLGGTSEEDKVIRLIEAIDELKANIGIPPTIRELMQSVSGVRRVSDAEYKSALDAMVVYAVDNQHTGTNPRAPLVSDLRQIMEDGYDAPIMPVTSLDFFSKV